MVSADMGVWGISTGPCSAGSEVPHQSQETVPGAGGEQWQGKCVIPCEQKTIGS